ncbi:MAG: hypothetical protein A3E83_03010 [Gammaproteobacteria bacterium RIFCSPHIGHO2_12_FULL_41_20]|nr:MAG: hypothetical protein A3E83_03010 [Gammaproteobacteria bacterium RIFCSPHIGHO2_12_FULL_41_20]
MAQARQSFISILSAAFTADPGLQNRCCRESIKALNNSGLTMRIFDEFPCLLPEEDIKELSDRFSSILNLVQLRSQGDVNTFTTENDVLMVEAWERKITKIGIAELLGKDGQIKPEIASLLTWPLAQPQARIYEIVCAYVGAINQVVIANIMEEIDRVPDKPQVIFDYINKHYSQWVVDELRKANLVFDRQALDAIRLPVVRPLFTKRQVAAAGIFVAGLGFLAVGLSLLFADAGKGVGTRAHRGDDKPDERQRQHGPGHRH